MPKQYVLVTAISHFRMRYCVPVDALDSEDEDVAVHKAKMLVDNQEVQEFSQLHISEDVVDTQILSEDELLAQFDADNDYLRSWTDEKKIEWVNNWKSDLG
jgi:hypothetical protein